LPPREGGREFVHYDRGVTLHGIHHLGVAVVDLDEALSTYTDLLGAVLEHRAAVGDQGVVAASVMIGESRLELLAPTGEDTPVGRFLEKRGPGMHHVAYEVDDVSAALREFAGAGAELIDEEPRQGLFGLEVAFVHPSSVHGVLTEVVARARS
jgi:methylmalonyl-CoA epimerase